MTNELGEPMDVICKQCGTVFKTRNKRKKYCRFNCCREYNQAAAKRRQPKIRSIEEIARAICSASNPDKPSVNNPAKKLWELWIEPARKVRKLIYGDCQ